MQDNTDTQLNELQAEAIYREMKYKRLYQLAYGYAPSQKTVDESLQMYYDLGLDTIEDLEEMVSETVDLADACDFLDVPTWMAAAAPNPQTHRRWLTTGRV